MIEPGDNLQPNMVAIRLPALFHQKKNGDINGAECRVEIRITFPDGSITDSVQNFKGKSAGPYERQIEVKHPSLKP